MHHCAHYDEPNIHVLKFPLISYPKYDILKVIPLSPQYVIYSLYNYSNSFTKVQFNRLQKQLEYKDLNKLEVVKLRKIIRKPTELMDLSVKLQDSRIKKRTRFIISEPIIYTITSSTIILIIVIIVINIVIIVYTINKRKNRGANITNPA